MLCRRMGKFTGIMDHCFSTGFFSTGFSGNGKADGIGASVRRYSRTLAGVAKIAKVFEFGIRRDHRLWPGSACSAESRTQGKPARKGPRDGDTLFRGKKIRTSHNSSILV